jgi:hypothetical protein
VVITPFLGLYAQNKPWRVIISKRIRELIDLNQVGRKVKLDNKLINLLASAVNLKTCATNN